MSVGKNGDSALGTASQEITLVYEQLGVPLKLGVIAPPFRRFPTTRSAASRNPSD
jgi:hypothetical protein